MDERLKKRIYAFYLAGALNLILGCWVLIQGGDLKQSTRSIMMLHGGTIAVESKPGFGTRMKLEFRASAA